MTMQTDSAYHQALRPSYELEHSYGSNYHILSDPLTLSLLAQLSEPSTLQPEISYLVRDLYHRLIQEVIAREFPCVLRSVATRMAASEPERGIWTGSCIDPKTRAITVNIARAGSVPSQVCFEFLNRVLDPAGVRQDHVVMARNTDAEQHVTGARFGDSKIGGDIEAAIVLFPDPMGATGSSILEALRHYQHLGGKAMKFIALNLIVTPEYLRALKSSQPELLVYALRLDRGASSSEALSSQPGTQSESGLSPVQYILPGAGGLGEIMNNAYC